MKNIVITGGANGIGRALVEGLVTDNHVYVIDSDKEAGEQLTNKLASPNFHFFEGDLSDALNLENFVSFITARTKEIDGLIHNAAIDNGGLVSGASLEEFMQVMRVNVGAAYYLTQQLSPYFSNNASVILMSSTRNRQSMKNNESYSSSKGAILSLTHAMANSLRLRARVNTISPGRIDTRAYQVKMEDPIFSHGDRQQHAVGRVGTPEDVLQLVLFLLDEEKSGFITGQEFVVDGGMSKQMIYHDEDGWTFH